MGAPTRTKTAMIASYRPINKSNGKNEEPSSAALPPSRDEPSGVMPRDHRGQKCLPVQLLRNEFHGQPRLVVERVCRREGQPYLHKSCPVPVVICAVLHGAHQVEHHNFSPQRCSLNRWLIDKVGPFHASVCPRLNSQRRSGPSNGMNPLAT